MDRIPNIKVDAYSDVDGNKLAQGVSLAKARAGDTLHLATNDMFQMHKFKWVSSSTLGEAGWSLRRLSGARGEFFFDNYVDIEPRH